MERKKQSSEPDEKRGTFFSNNLSVLTMASDANNPNGSAANDNDRKPSLPSISKWRLKLESKALD